MRRIFIFLLPLAAVFSQPSKVEKAARLGYESIRANDLRSHLTFLASDELEGRETSYRGQKVAARYIAAVFQKLGLKPAGDSGTYFQHFNLEITHVHQESNIVARAGSSSSIFSWIKDYVSFVPQDTSVRGPAVFVGYMGTPLDSSVQASLRGRIVIALAGKRTDANDTSRAAFQSRLFPFTQVPGSLATLVVTDDAGPISYERVSARFRPRAEKGTMRLPGAGASFQGATGPIAFYVRPELFDRIATMAGKTARSLREHALRDAQFSPVTFDSVTIMIHTRFVTEMAPTENVLAVIEGSDPVLKSEYAVFTAHYDHLGVASNGAIYHGADDDGSGTSAILELAEAFATNPQKPKRSLLFMTVTGEEKGLLGSEYYVNHPVVPLEQTIADLNTDMIGRIDKKHEERSETRYVYLIGSDKISSELDSLVRAANRESEKLDLDYTFNDENDPNRFYRRSDHYNFARNGIPVTFFFTGVHADYHQPTDTVDKIMFDKMESIVRLIYYTGWKVANFKRMFVKNSPHVGTH